MPRTPWTARSPAASKTTSNVRRGSATGPDPFRRLVPPIRAAPCSGPRTRRERRAGHPRNTTLRHHRRRLGEQSRMDATTTRGRYRPGLSDSELLTLAVIQSLFGAHVRGTAGAARPRNGPTSPGGPPAAIPPHTRDGCEDSASTSSPHPPDSPSRSPPPEPKTKAAMSLRTWSPSTPDCTGRAKPSPRTRAAAPTVRTEAHHCRHRPDPAPHDHQPPGTTSSRDRTLAANAPTVFDTVTRRRRPEAPHAYLTDNTTPGHDLSLLGNSSDPRKNRPPGTPTRSCRC